MPANRPVTIGICAHNEEDTIGRLLDQIQHEDIPIKEIIVVVAGNDSTEEIVERKSEEDERILLVKEEAREGQIAAQNKILSIATGEQLILLDGDGLIKEDSLEKLFGEFNEDKILSGQEMPLTDDSFIGQIIELHGEIHHDLCLRKPRFSTNIGIMPTDTVESFPKIVLDDAFIEHQAEIKDLSLEYVPESVKYHNVPNKLAFFFYQQRKNWAGRFEAEQKGFAHSKPKTLLAKVFLNRLRKSGFKEIPILASLALIELIAYIFAKQHQLTGNFPVKWKRPS